jgi:hypothetical protein
MMDKFARFRYQPCLPLGEDGRRVTASQKHIAFSRRAATEGMVLLKNTDNALPLNKSEKIALFGKATIEYIKGGVGSGDVHVPYIRNIYDGFNGDFFVNYCRQRQMFESAEWLGKKRMPARSLKNPYLYVLCAEDENSRTVGLWNLWEDEILHPEIELDCTPKKIELYRDEGYLSGTTVRLTHPIPPYSCAFIKIEK